MVPNSKFKNPASKIADKFSWEANLKIANKTIETRRRSNNISDWDWAKSANGDTADFEIFWDI